MTRRNKTKWVCRTIVAFVVATWLVFPVGCTAFGIRTSEEASYKVLRDHGHIELREYDELVVAETIVKADFDKAGSIAFRRLFGYISGANAAQTKIAMTTPVLADSADSAESTEGDKILMTTPVASQRQGDGWRYTFVLPAAYTKDSAPVPKNADVKIAGIPRTKVAALRYSGSWNEQAVEQKTKELLEWIATNNLTTASSPRAAGYDPPWTIPFLRRNEVLIDVQ